MTEDDFSDPVAVWRAARGDPGPLLALLLSEEGLSKRTRLALVAWLCGALDHAPRLTRGTALDALTTEQIRRDAAAANYCRVAGWVRTRGFDIDDHSLLRQVARKWKLPVEVVHDHAARLSATGLSDDLEGEVRAYRAWRRKAGGAEAPGVVGLQPGRSTP
ncbi:MAG: hypothetical protein ACP5EN_07955 [Rhodovulum sp.]